MSRILITDTEPTYITRNLTEEFFDQARKYCADCELFTFRHIKNIDIFTDCWTIDETFLIRIELNTWKRAQRYAKLIAYMLSMSHITSEIDIYREGKSLFLRLILDKTF